MRAEKRFSFIKFISRKIGSIEKSEISNIEGYKNTDFSYIKQYTTPIYMGLQNFPGEIVL